MNNKQIAGVFQDIADLLEIRGENRFKIRAYQRVVRSIEHLPVELEQLVSEGRLKEIPGVGEAITKKITELVNTGKLEFYENLKSEFPEGISILLDIPHIGPRTAILLAEELGISSIEELETAILNGEVASLPRLGEKTAAKILHQIQNLKKKKTEQRIPIGKALPVVEDIISKLKAVPGLRNLTPAGSLRRFQETVGDIDLMGTSDNPEQAIQSFINLPQVKEVLASGTTRASVIIAGGLQVDLRIVDNDSFGSTLQYFTGSKQHNVNLRERARRHGLSLSEYGITDLSSGELEKYTTEEEFYRRQGLQYIPPELREGQQEIEKAENNAVPDLVELSDIKGDLHIHTDRSDGRDTLEAMVLAAKNRGYRYLGIADHSGASRIFQGDGLRQQIGEIKHLNQKINGIHVLSGIEISVKPDGGLNIPDDILAELDFVIASIHSSLDMPEKEMTGRIIKAIENPYVKIFAHPTSRRIIPVPRQPEREPIAVDMEAIFQAAASNNTTLEINSMPSRLDLKDTHAYRARELGIKLVINTDSHGTANLAFMKFGVEIARRAWCQASDILNTRPLDEVMAYLK